MGARSLPFHLVNKAAEEFNWPRSTLVGSPLMKELGQSKRVIKNHARRLFGTTYSAEVRKPVKAELEKKAVEDLILILPEIKKDSFYGKKFSTISMLETYIVQKERENQTRKVKPGVVDDILAQFN